VKAVLEDPEAAPIGEPLKATLSLLRKLVEAPEQVTAADAERARAAGVSDDALREAIYVMYLFSIYTRMADALDWEQQPLEARRKAAAMLVRRGYDI
jgi:alkylhydroperoxidase family enzyme